MNSLSNLEYRKVQVMVGERSFSIVLPKNYVRELGLERGDFVKVRLDGKRITVERAQS